MWLFSINGSRKLCFTRMIGIYQHHTVYDPSDHPSLIEIKKQNDCTNKFVFEKVTTDHKVEKIINNINIKKATGADGISAKIIKCSKSIIAPQITSILNMSIKYKV